MRSLIRPIPEMLERVSLLDPLSARAQSLVRKLVPDRSMLKDLLSGTWLGHPLHPMLTDVVIGAWTSAWFLDLVPAKRTREASDALVGIGVLAALPTAAAGLADWSDLRTPERRVGTFHALGNVTALSLYALSYIQRRRGNRGLGWWLSMLGSGAATFSGLLGGHLSFGRGVGVNQTAFQEVPASWKEVLPESGLVEDVLTRAEVNGVPIVVYRHADRIFALADRCSHRGCPLHRGTVHPDLTLECPCHGSTYRLEDGALVRGPATAPQPGLEARMVGSAVEVRAIAPA
jgi:nitrite reductase/ring-hydroxylating ferredoxin subunit/uncharacterized membrane protein